MRNAPWTVWRKRDLAYQIIVHALAVVGLIAAFGWATESRAQDRLLVEVNDQANTAIRYVRQDPLTDAPAFMPVEGDCDDYAWSKFILLARAGVAWSRMDRPVVTYRGQLHQVLVVDGRWVLDNIERRVVPLETARRYYRF